MMSFRYLFYANVALAITCILGLMISPNPILYFFAVFNIINAILCNYLWVHFETKKERKAERKVQVKDLSPDD